MAIEDFGGSVLGQKIEMVTADHQNKPDLATSIARRWYEVEGVDMITELTTSSVALAVQDLSRKKKKIDIVVGAATSRLTGDACTPYGFHWAFDTHALAVGTGGALVEVWRRHLVQFMHRRLCVLGMRSKKTPARYRQGKGRQGAGFGPYSAELFGLLVIHLLQAYSSKSENHRACQCRFLDTTNSIKQAAEFSASSWAARSWPACC